MGSFSTPEPSGVCVWYGFYSTFNVALISLEYCPIWLPIAGPVRRPLSTFSGAGADTVARFNNIIRECHRWRYRDNLEHVTSDVLHLPKKRVRLWRVNEVLCTQRSARDVDHDFGRVDEHRDIAGPGLKV